MPEKILKPITIICLIFSTIIPLDFLISKFEPNLDWFSFLAYDSSSLLVTTIGGLLAIIFGLISLRSFVKISDRTQKFIWVIITVFSVILGAITLGLSWQILFYGIFYIFMAPFSSCPPVCW